MKARRCAPTENKVLLHIAQHNIEARPQWFSNVNSQDQYVLETRQLAVMCDRLQSGLASHARKVFLVTTVSGGTPGNLNTRTISRCS